MLLCTYHNTYEEMKCTVPVEHVAEKKLIREIYIRCKKFTVLTYIREGSIYLHRTVLYYIDVVCAVCTHNTSSEG